MGADPELEALLSLNGASFEMATGYVVEFTARQTDVTEERPHGLSYALVFRQVGHSPIVRFDNAHAIIRPGSRYAKSAKSYDHWHQSADDKGRPYSFTTAMQLLDDFWAEVGHVMNTRGIPNDL